MRANFVRRHALHLFAFSAVISAIAVLGLLVLLRITQSPLLVFDVLTEQFAQEVVRPELTAIAVTSAYIVGASHCVAGSAFSGVIEPPTGSRITYRWQKTRVAITVDLPAGRDVRFLQSRERECSEPTTQITIRAFNIKDTSMAWRLPIAGPAEVGSETLPNAPSEAGSRRFDFLRKGSFEVFGRAMNLFQPGALYPISSAPISIPAGSRIGSLDGGDKSSSAWWFGNAVHSENGFIISATVEADAVTLFRPGLVHQSERFEFGFFSAILGDPNLGMLFLILVIITTTVQLVASWLGLWNWPEDH